MGVKVILRYISKRITTNYKRFKWPTSQSGGGLTTLLEDSHDGKWKVPNKWVGRGISESVWKYNFKVFKNH